jgi:hypothetical protein
MYKQKLKSDRYSSYVNAQLIPIQTLKVILQQRVKENNIKRKEKDLEKYRRVIR